MSGNEKVMVCVTQQKTCERLIKKGNSISGEKGELFVVHIAKDGWNFLGNSKEGEALDYLFDISKSVGANLTVLRSADVARTMVDFAKENAISALVLGESLESSQENNIISEVKKKLPRNIDIIIVPTYLE